jgi:hypothetical protein
MTNQSNDSGNTALKVCSNRNTITNEHKIVIIGDRFQRRYNENEKLFK